MSIHHHIVGQEPGSLEIKARRAQLRAEEVAAGQSSRWRAAASAAFDIRDLAAKYPSLSLDPPEPFAAAGRRPWIGSASARAMAYQELALASEQLAGPPADPGLLASTTDSRPIAPGPARRSGGIGLMLAAAAAALYTAWRILR